MIFIVQHDARMTFCYIDVQTFLIRKLEFGKSARSEGICAEAFRCARDQLSVLFSFCFTLSIFHANLFRYITPENIANGIYR